MLPLKYRSDAGLKFLQFCSHEELKDLVDILTTDKGERRWAEYLTGDERFKKHCDDLPRAWEMIAAEFQRFGADAIASLLRGGEGVVYREILSDVCSRLKLAANETEDLAAIEARLLVKVLDDSWAQMSDEEKSEFVKAAGPAFAGSGFDPLKMAPAALLAALRAAILAGGFAAYQVAMVIANGAARMVLNRGLALAANAGIARVIGVFAGPVGLVITSILSLPVLTGPAYRVTFPSVLVTACLRQKFLNRDML